MVERIGVLLECLGNICRSPLEEGILLHCARLRGVLDRLDVGSCGTGACAGFLEFALDRG